MNTANWNVLTFALVLGRDNLFNFVAKDTNTNLKQLLYHNLNNEQDSISDEIGENIDELLTLMTQNESTLLKTLLNEYRYLLDKNIIRQLLKIILRA